MTTDVALPTPSTPAPVNLGSAFDLALPLADRTEALLNILALAADLTVRREEADNPDAYADSEFREQEVRRRTLRGIEDLRQAANMAELRWAMANGHQTWVDADGAEVSLLDTIESQMPDEEQRKSSGRARQIWAFAAGKHSAVAAFRERGIPDEEIARVGSSGMSSVLGIVSNTRKKLSEAYSGDELKEKYEELIQVAAETTVLDTLKQKCRQMVDPEDVPPPSIPYSVENDGEDTWLVAKPSQGQLTDIIFKRLGDSLEIDKLLPEGFVRYWRSFSTVPAGQA